MRIHSLLPIFLPIYLASCGGNNSDNHSELVTVYDSRLLINCNFEGNMTIDESAEELSELGVDVYSSSCAHLTNIVFTESCADLSGELFVHRIRAENLTDLESSHYINIDELERYSFPERYAIGDDGVGYELHACSED